MMIHRSALSVSLVTLITCANACRAPVQEARTEVRLDEGSVLVGVDEGARGAFAGASVTVNGQDSTRMQAGECSYSVINSGCSDDTAFFDSAVPGDVVGPLIVVARGPNVDFALESADGFASFPPTVDSDAPVAAGDAIACELPDGTRITGALLGTVAFAVEAPCALRVPDDVAPTSAELMISSVTERAVDRCDGAVACKVTTFNNLLRVPINVVASAE